MWLSDARRDVTSSTQAPVAAVTVSTPSHQIPDANHNTDSSPGNTWIEDASDVLTTQSASPVVSELIDKGVTYLRDRIFNRDSGKTSLATGKMRNAGCRLSNKSTVCSDILLNLALSHAHLCAYNQT